MKKKVKTILLQDISKVGRKYDLKELANGYAHYLYKNGQVNFYNKKTWAEVEKTKVLEQERELAALAEAQILQKNLNKLTLTFTLTKNQKGEVLGSVGFQEITSELKKSDITLAKKHLPSDFHSLNKTGEHTVPLKLGSGLTARLKIIIN
ncbi:MAG: 50S ribosomal protein L9 [Candidatus Moeniiplasma glomeromycotorum]|nr:50S ribosomal protein L9 [Candidatus Moeniiplasma glomeromycotorum]MCE8162189.1 50S ribosomal protein L9 [Candidatus Moeniiplasma glomeromycotorum]MCE8166155.1 50S ribosomal protein L9 [Candidatus Moeniiplasma glomeromycotorum]MCE8166588.1 50S ribosomal protein L9 [Candidatus Moeniiplasma glomeromycotorum]